MAGDTDPTRALRAPCDEAPEVVTRPNLRRERCSNGFAPHPPHVHEWDVSWCGPLWCDGYVPIPERDDWDFGR